MIVHLETIHQCQMRAVPHSVTFMLSPSTSECGLISDRGWRRRSVLPGRELGPQNDYPAVNWQSAAATGPASEYKWRRDVRAC